MKVTLSTSGGTEDLSGEVALTADVIPETSASAVKFFLDDVLLGTSLTPLYTYAWDSAHVTTGAHELKAQALVHGQAVEATLAVTVLGVAPPTPDPIEGLPPAYEFRPQDLVTAVGDGLSNIGVNSDVEGIDYGVLQLESSVGTAAGVRSYGAADDGVFYADKMQDDPEKFFSLKIDGFPAISLDAPNATPEDVANALIDLGLASAP
jgi:hypothetical protein